MPLIREIDALADGFTVVTTASGTFTITSADLTPAQKAMTPAQLEAVVNTFLASRVPPGEFAACHLTSVVPLLGFILISDDPISGTWWPT